jgi:hypothetical protein
MHGLCPADTQHVDDTERTGETRMDVLVRSVPSAQDQEEADRIHAVIRTFSEADRDRIHRRWLELLVFSRRTGEVDLLRKFERSILSTAVLHQNRRYMQNRAQADDNYDSQMGSAMPVEELLELLQARHG